MGSASPELPPISSLLADMQREDPAAFRLASKWLKSQVKAKAAYDAWSALPLSFPSPTILCLLIIGIDAWMLTTHDENGHLFLYDPRCAGAFQWAIFGTAFYFVLAFLQIYLPVRYEPGVRSLQRLEDAWTAYRALPAPQRTGFTPRLELLIAQSRAASVQQHERNAARNSRIKSLLLLLNWVAVATVLYGANKLLHRI